MGELDIVMKLRAIAGLSPPSIQGVTALNPLSREAIEAGAAEIDRLRAALRTVLGDADHGQNMTWEERCRIGRAALE